MKKLIVLFFGLFMIPQILNGEKNISKLPIIFSRHYDIKFLGLENLHPFDSRKYGKVHKYLTKKMGIGKDVFYEPKIASKEDLSSVHTKEYLDSLTNSKNIARIAGMKVLSFVPNFILRNRILLPMKYATGGTILGCELAMEHGWAINLSGGYHHAKADSGDGFCFFADIPIAAFKTLKEKPGLSILIVDLDAHQGNGCESIIMDTPNIHIFDAYNKDIYPGDTAVKKYIDFHYPLPSHIKDKEYLSLIAENLPRAIARSKPDLIIYNAGTDIFQGDPLGAMDISEDGVIKRDELVFKIAFKNKVPILMVPSGGYSKASARIMGKSIENILKNIIKFPLPYGEKK